MNDPKIIVFVQARMGSTRLPNKVLKTILGKPILLYQIDRIRKATTIDDVVVITTVAPADQAIADLCIQQGINHYRGSELDLLDRHYQAAKHYGADFVVKIPSDSPLTDPKIVDEVINLWKNNPENYDYVSNYHAPTFPDGLDVEGCPFSVLEMAWKEAQKPHEREHTFPFIWDQPERFRIGNVVNPRGDMFISHRWTLDYEEDFEFMRQVFEHFAEKPDFSCDDVLEFLRDNPHVADINRQYHGVNWYRNVEGQLKTVGRHLYRRDQPVQFTESQNYLERSKKVIPCATQTLSKGYTQWSVGAAPNFLVSGRGCEVVDVDGNVYVDYGMGLGPYILGYADPEVNAAVKKQLDEGTMFTLPHPLEVEAAELIIDTVPCAEMVRFGKNGSDATSAAVKLARAYTGREKIIVCGYHGWQDWYIASTERNKGIPQSYRDLVLSMEYNNIASLEKIIAEHPGEIAGLIMEPVYVNEPHPGYLEAVRRITKEQGIVLIFDEMFTGFRWSMGGAQEYFNVIPDLACFGKAIANGFPVSVITGRRDIMEEFNEVFFSFTYAGETLSLAAIIATIKKLREQNVHQYVWEIGQYLKDQVEALIAKHDLSDYLGIIGYPVKTAFNFKGTDTVEPLAMKTYWQQECAARGVLFIGYHLPSFSHRKEDIDFTLGVYDEIMVLFKDVMAKGTLKESLRGPVLTQIFKNVGDRSAGIDKKKT